VKPKLWEQHAFTFAPSVSTALKISITMLGSCHDRLTGTGEDGPDRKKHTVFSTLLLSHTLNPHQRISYIFLYILQLVVGAGLG